jgi:CubicO group peptidase (beta-lactamase class C family)
MSRLGSVVLALLIPVSAPAQVELKTQVDSFLQSRISTSRFSGTVLIGRDDAVVYERAAGMADREQGRPIDPDTRLEIASATKLLTRIAILQLAEAGKLALTDTVGKFLPDYPNSIVRSQVTIDQLLNHRSGIGSFWNQAYLARVADIRSVTDYLQLFQKDSLLFAPGTGQAYSNGGYVVLGAIIERVSENPYHDYIKERILQPVGMTRTGPYDRRAKIPNTAIGYTAQPLGVPMPGDPRLAGPAGPRPSQPSQPGAAGQPRLRILGPDGRELSPEEAEEARARRAAAPRNPNTEVQPGRSSPAGGDLTTVGDFFRLARALRAFRLLDSTHTMTLFGPRYQRGDDFRANGGGPGVNAEFSMYPNGYTLVVLSNYDPPAATEVAEFIRGLIGPSRSRQ